MSIIHSFPLSSILIVFTVFTSILGAQETGENSNSFVYEWNLLKKDEGYPNSTNGKRLSYLSDINNWNPANSPELTSENWYETWTSKAATMVFNAHEAGNPYYTTVKVDFTPLTLGGLIVKKGATGFNFENWANKAEDKNKPLTRFLNIWDGSEDNGSGTGVHFDLNETFTIGSKQKPFTSVNIHSNWNLDIAAGKHFHLYGEMQGGKGKTITLSKGGVFHLYSSNQFLQADWVLQDNSTILFNTESDSITNSNLLGSGSVTVKSTSGILRIGGNNNINLANDFHIEAGGALITDEQVRNGIASYLRNLVVYVNMTGDISGAGNWERRSMAGKNSTNESWIFTGDNHNFTGNWITYADVDYNASQPDDSSAIGDKPYDYTPLVFGNGSKFTGSDFHSIAGWGSIIGASTQTSRGGAVVGFNYSNDVTIFNNLEGYLKIRHLSNAVLTLAGDNSFIYGIYSNEGGTIRFTEAKNLGNADGHIIGSTTAIAGAPIILNNGSTLEFAGTNDVNLTNALFNDSGDWNIKVTDANATLNWALKDKGVYDKVGGYETSTYRTGNFTKLGAGTLNITAGKLIQSKGTNPSTIHIKEGTLAFTEKGEWGDISKIIITGGATLKSDRTMSIGTGLTLTTDKTVWDGQISNIDGNLLMDGGIMEFVMAAESYATTNSRFNTFNISGNFSINSNSKSTFNFAFFGGEFLSKQDYYLLFTAGNDLSSINWKTLIEGGALTLTGLPNTGTARQKYMLHTGGTTWNDGVNGEGGKNHIVSGNNNQVYIYVTPEMATLTWNLSSGGIWKVKNDQASWTGHENSNFHDGDSVIFGENGNDEGNKVISLQSNVAPSKIIVQGNANYSFESIGGFGIEGQGVLIKTGNGNLDIRTSNTYSGGTRVQGGSIHAYAQNSFGTGRLAIEDGHVFLEGENALGSSSIIMEGGGQLTFNSSNVNHQGITVNGGTLYAGAENAIGSGNLTINGGVVYANVNNAMGGANIKVTGGILWAYAENSLGSATTVVSKEGIIRTTSAAPYSGCLGSGSIILKDGGTLELNNSEALRNLSNLTFDGGQLLVEGNIDATYFTNVTLVNAKRAIINVLENSRLQLGGGLGANQNAIVAKQGKGELFQMLVRDFLSTVNIEDGKFHLHQGKLEDGTYTTHRFAGNLSGKGILELSGGSIALYSDLSLFGGTLLVNLDDNNQDLSLKDENSSTSVFYNVILQKGNIAITDNSTANKLYWGNLSSGSGELGSLSTIGMSKNVVSSTVTYSPTIYVNQTTHDIFKGQFINGGNDGTIATNLVKNGAATLTLSNDNTTTGTLTIAEGTIRIGNGGTTGHWNGKIINNSKLAMDYGNVVKTYDKEISGKGSVDISTKGTVIFTENNTYTGGTNISNGTVQLKDKGTLGTGDISMSGESTLDVVNGNGVENRTIRVEANSTATVKTATLGDRGILTTAMTNGEQAAISVSGGKLDSVTLSTANGKATLSGIVSGSAITLDASTSFQSPTLSDITLGEGSVATASNGTSLISNHIALSYGADSIGGITGNREITSAKLALGNGGAYNIGGMTQLSLNINQAAINSLGAETKFTIHLFGKDADLTKIFAGDDTSSLSNVVLDAFLQSEGWTVSKESIDGDSAWWKTGSVVLEKTGSVPEPSTSALLLAGALLAGFRRKRHA